MGAETGSGIGRREGAVGEMLRRVPTGILTNREWVALARTCVCELHLCLKGWQVDVDFCTDTSEGWTSGRECAGFNEGRDRLPQNWFSSE